MSTLTDYNLILENEKGHQWHISCNQTDNHMGFWHTSTTDVISSTVNIGGRLTCGTTIPDLSKIKDGYDFYIYTPNDIGCENFWAQNVTCAAPSDARIKIINATSPSYTDKLKSLGDVVSFRYKPSDDETIKTLKLDTENEHDGLIYQNAVKADIPRFTGFDDGYGYVNYLSSDYQAILLGAVQQLIKRVEELEKKK